MPRSMRYRLWPLVATALFVFYCTAVGVYLVLKPWAGPRPGLGLGASPFFRGFVSGLGLVHLAAAVADLKSLSRELESESRPETSPEAPAP